jgi:hypothetical protein
MTATALVVLSREVGPADGRFASEGVNVSKLSAGIGFSGQEVAVAPA